MSSLVDYLFGAASFMPHGYCLLWRPDLVAMHGVADALTAISYFSIPAVIHIFLKKRGDLQYGWLAWLFIAFISACGLTHTVGLATLWLPVYGLEGLVKMAAATISVATAILMWPLLPKALALPSPVQLREANEQLQAEILRRKDIEAELLETKRELERRVSLRTLQLHEANDKLAEMNGEYEDALLRLRTILDTAVSPIISIDDGGVMQDANKATTELLGYARDELIGANVSLLMTTEDGQRHDGYLESYGTTGVRSVIGNGREVTARRKDGMLVPIHLAVSEVSLKGKTLFTGILTDLTEQKKADKLKSEFVSTVSHELRTPLTSIKGSLGLLRSSVLGSLPEKAQSMINIAYSNCDRLVRLINDMLDIEKMEAGKLTFAFQRTEIRPFLERMVEANKAYTDELGVTLELADVAEGLQVETDPDRLAQVMTNLISNAAKFSPEGETVSIGVETGDSRIRISVTDRGEGISEAFQQKIFSKFSQADSSDTRAKGGTGLGLAITKAIVEAHGGSIAFETEVGEGTTFYFDLPLLQRDSSEVAVCKVEPGVSSARILHIEDEEDHHLIVCALIDKDTVIDRVGTCREARLYLAKRDYELVILDLTLPDGPGETLLPLIRMKPGRQPRILTFSAKPLEDAFSFHVDKALVKSQTDNEALKREIERQLALVEDMHDGAGNASKLERLA